ncbi:hypothetical protein C8Q74DRAFT_1208800 [Fomes fomentarius]|nr:hypothetical protein C8Q74DRAFT_1208800 [Fomes fomentarius]
MDDILNPNAHLVGLWLQIFFTGAYFVYLPQCLLILRRKMRDGLSLWMPITCFVMFIIVILDLVVEVIRGYQALAVSGPKGAILADPAAFWANPATTGSMIKNTVTIVLAIISDCIMVYRTYIVYNMNWLVIVAPVGLLLGDIGVGILASWTLAQTATGGNLIQTEVSRRFTQFFIITFCLNVICAILVCWKIRDVTSQVASTRVRGDRTTSRVFGVVIETAAFYCAHLTALIVSDGIGSNVFFIFLDSLPPVTALVFTMLIVRTRTEANGRQPITTTGLSTMRSFWKNRRDRTHAQNSMGVQINLERVVHTDMDSLRGPVGTGSAVYESDASQNKGGGDAVIH